MQFGSFNKEIRHGIDFFFNMELHHDTSSVNKEIRYDIDSINLEIRHDVDAFNKGIRCDTGDRFSIFFVQLSNINKDMNKCNDRINGLSERLNDYFPDRNSSFKTEMKQLNNNVDGMHQKIKLRVQCLDIGGDRQWCRVRHLGFRRPVSLGAWST